MNSQFNLDAYAPGEVATRVLTAGVAKAALPALPMFVLVLPAGAFITFGAKFFTLTVTDSGPGFGPVQLLGGVLVALVYWLVYLNDRPDKIEGD